MDVNLPKEREEKKIGKNLLILKNKVYKEHNGPYKSKNTLRLTTQEDKKKDILFSLFHLDSVF